MHITSSSQTGNKTNTLVPKTDLKKSSSNTTDILSLRLSQPKEWIWFSQRTLPADSCDDSVTFAPREKFTSFKRQKKTRCNHASVAYQKLTGHLLHTCGGMAHFKYRAAPQADHQMSYSRPHSKVITPYGMIVRRQNFTTTHLYLST